MDIQSGWAEALELMNTCGIQQIWPSGATFEKKPNFSHTRRLNSIQSTVQLNPLCLSVCRLHSGKQSMPGGRCVLIRLLFGRWLSLAKLFQKRLGRALHHRRAANALANCRQITAVVRRKRTNCRVSWKVKPSQQKRLENKASHKNAFSLVLPVHSCTNLEL